MSKTYVIMKDGNKIKTAKSLNAAKAIADQEQADVFCGDKCVYHFPGTEATEASQTAEASEEVKAVDAVHAVQASEAQSDVTDNAVEANSTANSDSATKADASSVSDMAEKPTVAPKPTVRSTAVEEEPRLGVSIHNVPQPKYENYRLTALMNVRAEASMQSKILRTAPAGTVVQVSHIENDWMKIRNGSDFAYILYEKDGKKFAERVGA